MKRMIFGHIYDTKSAELIADFVDSNSLSEAIYCEPDGTCFFVGSGGPNSIYSKYREHDRFIAVEDSIGDIEIERWTCQRSGNSYIYIFEEGDVWGICYSGSV